MPIVQVQVWDGFTEEQGRQIISGITDSFVQAGIPAQAVQIIIQEIPRSHWAIGGKQASERPRTTRESQPRQRPSRPRQDRGGQGRDTRPGKRPRRGGSRER